MDQATINELTLVAVLVLGPIALIYFFWFTNFISYGIIKDRILKRQKWGLNICCGFTDGGGVNADIFEHTKVPRFVQVDDVYNLPFKDNEFDTVLCSHTIEHVDDPRGFFGELQRVGKEVTIVIPPLWDLSAAFNLIEHKSLFLTLSKEHQKLPPHINLPFARLIHEWFGQRIDA